MNRRELIIGAAGLGVGTLATRIFWRGSARAQAIPMGDFDDRLAELGIALPDAPAPVATYAPWKRAGSLLFVAGQGPALVPGVKGQGVLGGDLSIDEGYAAARSAGLNVLAQVRAASGGMLNAVVQCLQMTGYVNCVDGFKDQPKVVNGASDLFVEVFGDVGKAARAAVGVNTLPFNVAVEIETVWELAA